MLSGLRSTRLIAKFKSCSTTTACHNQHHGHLLLFRVYIQVATCAWTDWLGESHCIESSSTARDEGIPGSTCSYSGVDTWWGGLLSSSKCVKSVSTAQQEGIPGTPGTVHTNPMVDGVSASTGHVEAVEESTPCHCVDCDVTCLPNRQHHFEFDTCVEVAELFVHQYVWWRPTLLADDVDSTSGERLPLVSCACECCSWALQERHGNDRDHRDHVEQLCVRTLKTIF